MGRDRNNTEMKATGSSWFKRVFSSRNVTVAELEAEVEREGPEAQNNLGVLFTFTERAAPAADCFRRAAERGDTVAQYNLALSYEQGRGVLRDLQEAQRWYLRAAESGDASAQFHLGISFHRESFSGESAAAEELKIEALKWLLLAAAQGHHNAERSCEPLILSMNPIQTEETNRRLAAFRRGGDQDLQAGANAAS